MLPRWVRMAIVASLAAAVVPLPFALVWTGFLVFSFLWGFYVVLPMLGALAVLAVVERFAGPRLVRAVVVVVLTVSVLYTAYIGLFAYVLAPLLLVPLAAVVAVGVRLFSRTSGSAASEPAGAWSGGSGGGGG